MQHAKIFNPEFAEEFEVGEDVEYLTEIEYISEKRKILEEFFKYISNNKVITNDVFTDISIISDDIEKFFYGDYSMKDFFLDFINTLRAYIEKLENNMDLYNELIYTFKQDDEEVYELLKLLHDNGIDMYTSSIKALKGVINDLENKGKQLLQKIYEQETINAFEKVKNITSSPEYSDKPDIINAYTEFLKLSNLNNVINFFRKQVFSTIYPVGIELWWNNGVNWFTNMLTNSFINKLSKSSIEKLPKEYNRIKINILLSHYSIGLLTDVIDRGFLTSADAIELYFKDEKRLKNFRKIKNFKHSLEKPLYKLLTNPNTLNYIHPDFLKQFKDFDDFIENSGIKKDGDYFSVFYYFGMLYGYDNNLIREKNTENKNKFKISLLGEMPIQKNHIRSYIDKQVLSIYKLKPNSIDEKNETNSYSREKLIKYFGVSNKSSCIRKKLLFNKDIKSYNIHQDVSFIILVNKDGNTVGRFIDVGNGLFVNMHYNSMAYRNAYLNGGKDIIGEYTRKYKNIDKDFTISYNKPLIYLDTEDFIKKRMKTFKDVFHMNDYIKVDIKR